jgi:hypothetical protein
MARAASKAPAVTPARLREVIGSFRYSFASERDLQDGIAQVLFQRGIRFDREVRLSDKDRPDFMVDGIAVEVKVEGSPTEIQRQLSRYADSKLVTGLLLVSRKMQHAHKFPASIGGKPLVVVTLEASAL